MPRRAWLGWIGTLLYLPLLYGLGWLTVQPLVATGLLGGWRADQIALLGTGLSFLLLLVVALAVVALLSLVGVVLAIALLAIPPLVALRLFRSLPAIVAGGCVVGLAITVGGLALAARVATPAGPTIILLGGVLLGLVQLLPQRALRAAR